ncbi:RagB/SusD family nutrient uptake outer membrane protein [Parapedobacter sp. 2B3]|uniref:RagB/SusD family nutrient uptake outer membrane protein n=1 Tax=Parapedobacter sp. 2B3 TaxID=3342381 RepID=UPI0035B5F77E
MTRFIYIISLLLFLFSCTKLDNAPQGIIADEQLNTPENIDKLCIAAYSGLGNDWGFAPYASLWVTGSVRSDESYKGGDGVGDQDFINAFEVFTLNRIDNWAMDVIWYRLYVGIKRVNLAIAKLNATDEQAFPAKGTRLAEMRFLRGHFYFMLKILFKHIPYIDETVLPEAYSLVSNRALTNDELWNAIEAEFAYAAEHLPDVQDEVGRANKWAAKAYQARAVLYHAYTQGDDDNTVTGIDAAKLNQVISLCDDVIASGKYALSSDFAHNFLTAYENGPESIFAIQFSKDDGTPVGRLATGDFLNYPMNPEYGCCGFHMPSQHMVNAFKTSAQGLPLFDTFDNTDMLQGDDFLTYTFDPRLDHTVAIVGHPYKYEPDFVFARSWLRAPEVYGLYMSMKETVAASDPSFKKMPPFMSSSKNQDIIRYDDILLYKAEALIELNRQNEALPLINLVRQRAINSTGLLKQADNSSTSNYHMAIYVPGVNCTWSNDFARKALRWERKIEFSMEGWRFFDLVRWGIAAETLNAYFAKEKTRRPHLNVANFEKDKDEYFPIPLNQINYSSGLYEQNPGWERF